MSAQTNVEDAAASGAGGQAGELADLPRWEQLPDIELYMDQVVSLLARYLGPFTADEGKALTASMVNNYVKTGLVPPPVKKRYTREHLALLMVVCTLKPVLPLASIRTLIDGALAEGSAEELYGAFRASAEKAADALGSETAPSALDAALGARMNRDLAIGLLRP